MAKFVWQSGGGSAPMRQALEIVREIVEFVKVDTSTTKPYQPVSGTAEKLRQYVRVQLRKEGIGDRVNTAVDGNMLFVHVKEVSRVEKLEKLIEKMMMDIENETLFDEAMEVLHGQK